MGNVDHDGIEDLVDRRPMAKKTILTLPATMAVTQLVVAISTVKPGCALYPNIMQLPATHRQRTLHSQHAY